MNAIALNGSLVLKIWTITSASFLYFGHMFLANDNKMLPFNAWNSIEMKQVPKKKCKFSFSYDSLNTDHIKLDAIDYNAKFGTDNIDVSTFNSYNFRFSQV